MAQWVGCHPGKQKVASSIPGQGPCLGGGPETPNADLVVRESGFSCAAWAQVFSSWDKKKFPLLNLNPTEFFFACNWKRLSKILKKLSDSWILSTPDASIFPPVTWAPAHSPDTATVWTLCLSFRSISCNQKSSPPDCTVLSVKPQHILPSFFPFCKYLCVVSELHAKDGGWPRLYPVFKDLVS